MDTASQKQRLIQRREELLGRVERTHKHIHEREERISANFSEQSVEMESQQLIMSLDADGRNELRAINAALERIEKGTYGECSRCGGEISDARLEALPYAGLCIDCAKASEV